MTAFAFLRIFCRVRLLPFSENSIVNNAKTKSGIAIIVAAGALGWLGYTALSLGNRPERIAPSRSPRSQGAEAGGERQMQHTLTAGTASAARSTPRDWAATNSAALAETTLASLSTKLAQEGAAPTGSSAMADKLGQNIRTIFTPLLMGQSDQFRATLGSLGAAPPNAPSAGGAPAGPGAPPGGSGNPMFKALNGAQLDLAHAKVRRLSPEEAKQGPMGGRRRGPGGGGPGGPPGGDGGDDFGAVVAAGFRGAFPEAEKNMEAGTAQVVEVTVPLLLNGATDPDPNAKISFKMVYDKAADAWQPMMLALALKDPAILKQFAPQGG